MYKNKKIALIFFARSNSKRLKNKLFKKISNHSILTTCILLTKKIKFLDYKIIATTKNEIDNKIISVAKNNDLKFYRGSEDNVLQRMFRACKSLKEKPDFIIRFCSENPLTSTELIEKSIKKIVDEKLDLISVIKPSNLLFGIAPIVLSFKALEKIYNESKNKVYREHVENYCYDYSNRFKIHYLKGSRKFFFPDTNFSIDSFNDFKRVKEIFNVAKLKPGKYDYKNIFSLFNKKKIFIKNDELRRYCNRNYKNFYFTNSEEKSNIVFNENFQNKKKIDNVIYFYINFFKSKFSIFCIKNKKKFELIKMYKIKNMSEIDYLKLFFSTLIKKIIFWPPLEIDDLTTSFKNLKILKKNIFLKINDYFPTEIVSNKKIQIKELNIAIKIVNDRRFKKLIKTSKRESINKRMFVFNENFVYFKNNKIVKIKKFDYFKIVYIWRSYDYSIQ